MNLIREIMSVDIETAAESQDLSDVIDILSSRNISFIVVTKGDKPTGLITERDLITKVLYKKRDIKQLKVSDVMTSPIISVHPDIEIGDALGIMESNHIRRLVVVEDDALVGLITNTDVAKKMKSVNSYNNKLVFYQNIQSYVIFVFFIFIIIYFVIKYFIK